MEYSVYDTPNRAVITSEWGEIETALIRHAAQVRYRGGVKSPILKDVSKSDKVTVLEDEDDWMKVATEDGIIGYVKTNALKDRKTETISREFEEPVYTNISEDYTINLAWHNVSNADANNYVQQMLAQTKGLTTIAPTWFSIADTEGNMSSLGSADYVSYAHQSGLEVWAVLRDFHGGINSYDETCEVLSYTSKRTRLIDQAVTAARELGVDGINLDFELISTQCGEHYVQFVRELSVSCRQNGLVFSVDNYVPQPYNAHYDLQEQGVVADYVMIMGYDEHTVGSEEAGSVASLPFVEEGITQTLEEVPKEKVINGVPFYTRLWTENNNGTVSSEVCSMDQADAYVEQYGMEVYWNTEVSQNYAEAATDGGVLKMWMEDEESLEEKMKLIQEYDLAGVAEWKLGFERADVWAIISKYIQ